MNVEKFNKMPNWMIIWKPVALEFEAFINAEIHIRNDERLVIAFKSFTSHFPVSIICHTLKIKLLQHIK